MVHGKNTDLEFELLSHQNLCVYIQNLFRVMVYVSLVLAILYTLTVHDDFVWRMNLKKNQQNLTLLIMPSSNST